MKKIALNGIADTETTLQWLFEDFISRCKVRNLADATLKSYHWQFNIFKKYLPAETLLSDISVASVKKVVTRMLDEGAKPVSVNTMLRHMNAVFNYANELGLISSSPKVQFLKAQQEVKDCYTEQEILALIKKPSKKNTTFREFRTWTEINLLLATGIRLKTISNIKIGDIDFDNCLVKLSTLKNKKVQVLPLSPALVPVLKEYLKIRKGSDDDFLFCTETGTQLKESSIYHDICLYNTTRGVEKTSVHLFRHSFAKHYVISGGDPIRLQKWLGHSTLGMTMHYCNLYDTDLIAGADKFNLLDNIKPQNERIKMK